MPDAKLALSPARQVELAIRQLDSLSILPSVAVQFFPKLLQSQLSTSDIADIIELDTALMAKALSLVYEQGLDLSGDKLSLRQALDKLPERLVRDVFFSVKVLGAFDSNDKRAFLRKDLALHALSVACCAEEVAEVVSPPMDPKLVHCAGLLHDIGKFALLEAMPKSFAHIIEAAKSTRSSACATEQKHLGIDHTILGKRLSHKWHLPEQVALAVWLHHSDVANISDSIPEARMGQVVQLADSIARESGLGQSGSFDSPEPMEQIARSIAISFEQLQQIRQKLPDKVRQKSGVLGLDLPNAASAYCDIVHSNAARLVHEQAVLSPENRKLQSDSSHFDFIKDFLLSINSADGTIDMAEKFAVRWQKFYQTGIVCLYLAPHANVQTLEAVLVENFSQTKLAYLEVPVGTPAIPRLVARDFSILEARDYVEWLFEQLDVDFDLNQTKLMPLLSDGRAVGAILFELRYPADLELFQEKFKIATSIAGTVLDVACSAAKQQYIVEKFAQLLAKSEDTKPQDAVNGPMDALVEMAAGAAHELNNPLSVISGRAQYLNQNEIVQEKKQILSQIQENAGKISRIIDELMNFAKPPEPKPTQVNARKLLDEAIQLTGRKTGVGHINIQLEVAEDTKSVFVDSDQIVSAIANVLSNAIESYTGSLGPIKVIVTTEESGNFVMLQISDLGCGMDAQTLEKAAQPFFSVKPAGRKRGMGLAYAQRVIRLNKGQLRLISQPDSGTTVTIILPCK